MSYPGSAHTAVAFTFDFDAEEVWIGADPANAGRPGVLSQGTYGAKVAVPAILAMLDRQGVRATFFVPGRVGERHPGRVRDIVAAGHEVGHHGYTHTSPADLPREQEEAELVRARAVLEDLGATLRGYRSPSWELSPATVELLAAHGFAYSSNCMDDIRPYRHPDTAVVELPVHWMLDDAAHFWFDPSTWTKKISTTAEVEAIWHEELDGIVAMGGVCIFTMHPQIIGRPSRLAFLERFVEGVRARDDVWVAACEEIAAAASPDDGREER